MRILVLSDIHERTHRFKHLSRIVRDVGGVSLVIVAGDITYFKQAEVAIDILGKLRDTIGSPVVFIPGNCDDARLLGVMDIGDNLVNIHGRFIEFNDLILYGVGGGGISPFHTMIEYSEEDFARLLGNAEGLDPGRLVMVTHHPVYGFFDEVSGSHIGSKVFRDFMERRHPLLWVTGHIHEHSGWLRAGATTIVHPGPFMRGYYGLVELDNGVATVNIGRL